MALGLHADAVEQGQPRIAQRRVLWCDEVVAELDPGTAAGEERGAVVEVVLGADVAAVSKGDVVEQTRTIGFFGRFEFVDESGEQLALHEIALLRGGELFAHRRVVVTHVVRRDFDADARQQRAHRLAVGQHAGAVRLHRGEDDVIHDLDLFLARQSLLRLRNRRLRLRHADPLLVLREPRLDVADALEVFIELGPVVFAKTALHRLRVLHHRVEHAALLREHGLLLLDGRRVLGKQPMKRLHRAFMTTDGFAAHVPCH